MPLKAVIDGVFSLSLTAIFVMSCSVVLAENKSLCVFDLLGANGPVYAQMKDYKIAAMAWGVDFQLKPYTSEQKASTDFKSGGCDAVSFTGTQARQFSRFSGTLDAMAALPSYAHLKTVISTLSLEQSAPLMISEPYEVVGIIPMGSAFLFVNDRALVAEYADILGDFSGIRIAVMNNDPAQIEMSDSIGTLTVGTSIAEMYSKFNAGLVDVTYGPAVIYEAMELYKGIAKKGGVVRFSLAQLTLQIMIRKTKFPESFGKVSREFALSQFDGAVARAKNYEDRIGPQWWINISDKNYDRYHEMYRKIRLRLRDKGIYDSKMLTLMRMVRCKKDPQQSECTAVDKE